MRQYKSQNRWDVIGFLLRSFLTLLAAGILALQANGYEIDYTTLTWQKAGLIVVNVEPTSAQLIVDGSASTLTGRERTVLLSPRTYTATVKQDGFSSWQQTVHVEAGRAHTYAATLYWLEPKLLATRQATVEDTETAPSSELRIDGGELWHVDDGEQKLITRFSQTIASAVFLDRDHILLQLGSSIRVIDLNGSNDRILIQRTSDEPVRLVPRNGGRAVEVVTNELVTTYGLRP